MTTILGLNYTRLGHQIGYYSIHFLENGTNYMNYTGSSQFFDDGTDKP